MDAFAGIIAHVMEISNFFFECLGWFERWHNCGVGVTALENGKDYF